MLQTQPSRYSPRYQDHPVVETPFMEAATYEGEIVPMYEASLGETNAATWHSETPFLHTETFESGAGPTATAAALAEITQELKDGAFRETLEQLVDEAVEAHAEQLAGEYGDRESHDVAALRLLHAHFQPLAARTDATLDRFFNRLETYEAEALTDGEIARLANEVMQSAQPASPVADQFLGGLLHKVGKLVSKVAKAPLNLAAKGLALAGKLALGPLLGPIKKLARFLLSHVVSRALNQMPASLKPWAQQLSARLFHEIPDAHEYEDEHDQAEAIPAAPDVARMEAEFDLHAAQLLFIPDEAEADDLVSSYGESPAPGYEAPLSMLDQARGELADGLSHLAPGESAEPVIEHFLPALAAVWPAVKAGIAVIGRPRFVKFVGGLLANLIKPILGADPASKLAPYIADTGLHLVGLEAPKEDPRAIANEALSATIEETLTSLGELPAHVFENETLLESAVREAFEDAAATYFPGTLIRPELRETTEAHGTWMRLPRHSHRKRYAKYSQRLPVEITPRTAELVHSFGGSTLKDHLRDRMDIPHDRTLKTHVRLYHALPGTQAAAIARAEHIRPHDLHPLTPHAAAVLLGPNAGLGSRHTPAAYLVGPHKLHLRQRLYYVEPPNARHHLHHRQHARRAHSELMINLQKGEMRVWLYLSERLCQHIAAEFAKSRNAATAFRLVKPLIYRTAHMLKASIVESHLPPTLRVVGGVPNLDSRVPAWLVQSGRLLSAKIDEWLSQQVAQYLRNNTEELRRIAASEHDGLTLTITMSNIPGIEALRFAAQGHPLPPGSDWLTGTPGFAVIAHPGHVIR
jgi:hypothetical protein